MRFPDQPFRRLTPRAVAVAPDRNGLYGLFRLRTDGTRRCLFIGYGNVRRRLREHVAGIPPEILAEEPVEWITASTAAIEVTLRELVDHYRPVHHDASSDLLPYSGNGSGAT